MIEGAAWTGRSLKKGVVEANQKLPKVCLKWIHKDESSSSVDEQKMVVPMYLNSQRQDILFSVKIECEAADRKEFYQGGVALIASPL